MFIRTAPWSSLACVTVLTTVLGQSSPDAGDLPQFCIALISDFPNGSAVVSLSYSSDSKYLAASTDKGNVAVWETMKYQRIGRLANPRFAANSQVGFDASKKKFVAIMPRDIALFQVQGSDISP